MSTEHQSDPAPSTSPIQGEPRPAEILEAPGEAEAEAGRAGVLHGPPPDPPAISRRWGQIDAAERARAVQRMQAQQGNGYVRRVVNAYTGARQVQRQPAPAPAPAPGGGGAGGAELIAKGQAIQAAAQKALSAVYGWIKKIVPGDLQVVDQKTLFARYDEYKIRRKHNNPKTGELWKMDDAAKVFQSLDGFTDLDNKIIYVLDTMVKGPDADVSLAVHEMLHVNAAGGFGSTVGPDIDEGTTQTLTVKACKNSQIPVKAAYAGQTGFVSRLIEVVGEGTLTQAYFNGAGVLTSTFDTVRGEGQWEKFHRKLVSDGMSEAGKILSAPTKSTWVQEKIASIQRHLGYIVWDSDIEAIRVICSTLTPEELTQVRAAILPQVNDLWDHGQRAKLRMALGS